LTSLPRSTEHFPIPLRLVAWAFPVFLWFLATFFLLGDLGWWNDDYYFSKIDPATGTYSSIILTTREPFLPATGHLNAWRPLHFIFTPAVVTLSWNSPWIAHLVGALSHGVVCLLLYRLMRSVGASLHAAAACALLFMVHPLHYEVPLWPAAFATGVANGVFILNALLMARAGRSGARFHYWTVPLLTGIAICLNEQSAPCIGALPLLYLAVCPCDESRKSRLVRSCVPVFLGCVVVIAYVVNVRINGQQGLGTDPQSYIRPSELPARIGVVLGGMFQLLQIKEFGIGAGLQALIEYFEYTGRTVVVLGSVVVTGLAAAWMWIHSPIEGRVAPCETHTGGGRAWWVLAFAAGWMVLACVPQAVIIGYNSNSRTFHLVCAAMFFAFSIPADWMAMAMARVPGAAAPYRVVSALLLLMVLVCSATLYVGVQGRHQRVHREGIDQARQLRELIPDPQPGTYFLPVAHYAKPIQTGVPVFDNGWSDVWCGNWAQPAFIKHAFRRNDVYQGFYNPFFDGQLREEPVLGIDFEFVDFVWKADSPYGVGPGLNARIPLAKVVPFLIDPDGQVRIITHWWVQPQGGSEFMVEPPTTADLMRANQLPPFMFNWPEPDAWPLSRPQNGPTFDPNLKIVPPGPRPVEPVESTGAASPSMTPAP